MANQKTESEYDHKWVKIIRAIYNERGVVRTWSEAGVETIRRAGRFCKITAAEKGTIMRLADLLTENPDRWGWPLGRHRSKGRRTPPHV